MPIPLQEMEVETPEELSILLWKLLRDCKNVNVRSLQDDGESESSFCVRNTDGRVMIVSAKSAEE